jgi:predicted ATP-binding protein involved in virulence
MRERVLPALFNTANYLDYVGAYPELKYYEVDYLSSEERAQFSESYAEQKDKHYRNKEELLAYCLDNVNVLRQACCAFRSWFLKLVKMYPFRRL